MTRNRVRHDAILWSVAWVIALTALLAWPGRETMDALTGVLVGLSILTVVGFAVERLIFKRWPRDLFGRRPGRYSWPNAAGLFTSIMAFNLVAHSASPDRAVHAFASSGLILVGSVASNLSWARATEP